MPSPRAPGAVAVTAEGHLYVADAQTNVIYTLNSAGQFAAFAGTGIGGFSGDGGAAAHAQLNEPTGLAVGGDGTLYIADTDNNRVRAVKPDGIIETIAGSGATSSQPTPSLAPLATESAISHPRAVAVTAGGILVASGNAVVKVRSDGAVSLVLGPTQFSALDPRFPRSNECDPDALATDTVGDLYVACANTKYLLVRLPSGVIRYLGPYAPHAATSTLSRLLDGTVVGIDGDSVLHLVGTTRSVIATVNAVEGTSPFEAQGIAGASSADFFVDQDGLSGKGPAAIVRVDRGAPETVWTGSLGQN
jgi:sugar lactone lactonase YvrE